LTRLRSVKDGELLPFSLLMDDPSGNSFLENPFAPRHDPNLRMHLYSRSIEQDHAMGLYAESAGEGMTEEGAAAMGSAAGSGGAATGGFDATADDTKLVGSSARTTLFPPQVGLYFSTHSSF
jgi:zinc finger protein